MGELVPLPRVGDVFTDVRGDDRTMRVSRHSESGLVVVSLWSGGRCRASFHMSADEVPRMVEVLDTAPAPAPRGRWWSWLWRQAS